MLQKYAMRAYIPARDLERARRFYEGKVGLKPQAVAAGGVFYEFAGDDVERAVRELEQRGVQFEDYDMPGMKTVNHIFEGGGAKAAWFKDSEGNIMALVQATG